MTSGIYAHFHTSSPEWWQRWAKHHEQSAEGELIDKRGVSWNGEGSEPFSQTTWLQFVSERTLIRQTFHCLTLKTVDDKENPEWHQMHHD